MADTADVVIGLTADDDTWDINLTRDLTGRDWLAMERHDPNISFAAVCNAVVVKKITTLALVLWAFRRHDEPDLDYDDVLGAMSAASVGDFRVDGTPPDPPAAKTKKKTKGDGSKDPRPS